ncbi:MAG TPA: hypothetical protein PLO50_15605 [Nitrospira sp.]|nr:hypothetical protein [Nitrospira sp.]
MPSARSSFRTSPGILLALIAFQLWSAAAVCAEWLLVDRNERDAIYVDSESISRNGVIVRALVLDDLKAANTRGLSTFLSTRNQEEHDCSKERFRLVAIERFAGNMGTGHSIYKKSGESSWVPISRGTLAQSVWKFVCGKK